MPRAVRQRKHDARLVGLWRRPLEVQGILLRLGESNPSPLPVQARHVRRAGESPVSYETSHDGALQPRIQPLGRMQLPQELLARHAEDVGYSQALRSAIHE